MSVCVSICIKTLFDFLGLGGEGVGGLTCDCEGNRLNSNNRSMWFLKLALRFAVYFMKAPLTRWPSQIHKRKYSYVSFL